MAEYIEREAARQCIHKWLADIFGIDEPELTVLDKRLNAIHSADVVPVVRCGECVFHEVADYGGGYTKNVCRLLDRQIQNDDFCSYGARMDGDGE